MKLSIRYFASIREGLGLGQEAVQTEAATVGALRDDCLLYTSPSPRDGLLSRMPSSA